MTAIPISDTVPDWTRETPTQYWDPGRRLLKCVREAAKWRERTGLFSRMIYRLIILRHRFWSVVSGAEIPLNCSIGGGLMVPHPDGIVIHPRATIGVNCLILQQVTIGTVEEGGFPVIDGHVDIGAGAKILGDIRIGANAKIGANAVVLIDVPPGAVAVGVPARIIPRRV